MSGDAIRRAAPRFWGLSLLLGVGLGLWAVALLLWPPSQPRRAVLPQTLATVTEQSVTITFTLEADVAGLPLLVAQFVPTLGDYHFYSKDLPPKGVEGLGRPTLLALAPDAPLQARGAVWADAEPEALTVSGVASPLWVYPNGPVRLALPIEWPTTPSHGLEATALVSYMTCSDSGYCTAPVTARPVTLHFQIQP